MNRTPNRNRRLAVVCLIGFAAARAQAAPERLDSPPKREGEPRVEASRGTLLPEAVASFGSAAADGWLYVYGGHVGRTHEHSRDNISPAFRRLNLVDGASWEELPQGERLQGASLVEHWGRLYRVGGLSAVNARGEAENLRSVASVSRFDPVRLRWEDLTPLPEPRSSHDAVVQGGALFVAGGWNTQGPEKTWHKKAWRADLSADVLRWEAIPDPPFALRALALAAPTGKLCVLGGMEEGGSMSRAVHLLDLGANPRAAAWKKGPDLPFDGFGMAAVAVGDAVRASGSDGVVYELRAEESAAWRRLSTLAFPRIFHRLVPDQTGQLLVVGGGAKGGHLRVLERIETPADAAAAKLTNWEVPYPGKAKSRQSAFLDAGKLILFGGNRSVRQHDFAPDDFLDEAFEVDLGSLRVTPLDPLAARRQSQQAIVLGDATRSSAFLGLGGFGHDGEVARAHAEVFRFDPKKRTWATAPAKLPVPRTQFGAAEWGGKLWIFGGADFGSRGSEKGFIFQDDVLAADLGAESPAFAATGHKLPRGRRAFGGACIGDRYHLIGGMAEDFGAVEVCDVFDFRTGKWETIPSPGGPRISPDCAALDGKLYLAGGSAPRPSYSGRLPDGGTAPHTALECFDPATASWSRVVESLPFPSGHIRMLPLRDRLLFWSTFDPTNSVLRLAVFAPGKGIRV